MRKFAFAMRWEMIRSRFLVLALFCATHGFIFCQKSIGQTFSSLFFLDGRNILENYEFALGLDDIIRFEAYELLPGTVVNMKVSGKGIKTVDAIYPVNQRGEVKTNLFFPQARGRLTFHVAFTTKNGAPEEIKFFLVPAY